MGTEPDFTIVLTGYDRKQVDDVIIRLRTSPPGTVTVPDFRVVLRGYEKTQVDDYLRRFAGGAAAVGPATEEPAFSLDWPDFKVVLRGYDRKQVDRYVRESNRRVAELEQALRAATADGSSPT